MSNVYIERGLISSASAARRIHPFMEQAASELWPDVPIRWLKGGARNHDWGRRWEASHRANEDHTAAQARETGITVWDYSYPTADSITRRSTVSGYPSPTVFAQDARPSWWGDSYVYIGDVLRPQGLETDTTIATWSFDNNQDYAADDFMAGAYREREIHTFFSMNLLRNFITSIPDDTQKVEAIKALFSPIANILCDNEYFQNLAERQREIARAQFAELARERDDRAINDLRDRIIQFTQQRVTGQSQVQEADTNLALLGRQMDAMLVEQDAPRSEADLQTEWDNILRMSHVRELNLQGRSLIVHTDDIEMVHPVDASLGVTVLGQYRIVLDFQRNKVRVHNETNRQGSYDHPHVVDGSFCAGSWQPTVDQLMRERQFGAAVAFVLDCLQSCNPRDTWGSSYTMWTFDNEGND